ncbi:MAG: translation initiation factor IF-2 [Fimbriimonadaceae bacterium]|nr:translation initiation factor IF-2 [Fimbriimonadaceae bacterium]
MGQTEVKNIAMQHEIAELAKRYGLVPGQVTGVLQDLGVEHDLTHFDAEPDVLELVEASLEELRGSKDIPMLPGRTPRDIAAALGLPQPEVQKTLMMKLKVMAQLTTALKPDVAEKLAETFGYKITWVEGAKPKPATPKIKKPTKIEGAQPRPPVVTILGHVDHGKTSLLDYIRKANVAAKEHGGITQHIGAYQVELPEGKITFLDTPGHAAFTAMRARGAQVTDIAILVVAADDGIMPQTIEAISHVKNAGVPMIVAVNKIDKPDANADRVLSQLPEHEVIPEAFGGQTIVCPVSAHTGEGVPHLLEMVLLQAEIMQLTADPKGTLEGVVIEAKVDRGRGPVATILVQNGTLKIGDALAVGDTFGRIKAMTDYLGENLKEAGPSTPVEILGLSDVPNAGDHVEWQKDERSAREIAEERQDKTRIANLTTSRKVMSLEALRGMINEGETKDLNLVVKADVQGSVEAVRGMLEKIENEEVNVRVIHSGVGPITESDILLASAAEAICVGFNTRAEPGAKKEAERAKVEIRTYNIIYELIEDIEAAVKGLLAPKYEEVYQGKVEIRMVFNLSRQGIVAGSHVTDGKITRNSSVRIKRGNDLVYEGKVASLRNVKQDVREMIAGQDCGLQFEDFTAFKEGDIVEAYEMVRVN